MTERQPYASLYAPARSRSGMAQMSWKQRPQPLQTPQPIQPSSARISDIRPPEKSQIRPIPQPRVPAALPVVNQLPVAPQSPPPLPPPQPQPQLQSQQRSQPRSRRLWFKPFRHRSRLQVALISMAVAVFGLGLLVNIQTIQTNHNAKSQVAALSHQAGNGSTDNSGAVPSETKPSGSAAAYQVAPNVPKYLKITKLGVNARVRALGVTSRNELQAPTNIYNTGWYNASARPGDPGSDGAILIDGHVHGPTLPGVFVNIKKLSPGDIIQIVRGDNQVFNYEVKKVQNYDASTIDMGMLLTSIQPGEPGLNLITCGGPYDRQSGEYTQRTVVFAVQQS